MLSQKIVDLLPELAHLPLAAQDAIAADLYANLVDARFRYNIENGIPMPAFEEALAEAKAQQARGEYISLDDWLDGTKP